MTKHKKLAIMGIIAAGIVLILATGLLLNVEEAYPGMVRISSRVERGPHEHGSPTIELDGLKAGQLVVIEANKSTEAQNSWIKHSSTETFVIEGRGFENGKLEYEVYEDADYSFQLNCESTEYELSISIWEKAE